MASIHDEVKKKALAYGKELVNEAVDTYKSKHVRTESGENIIDKVNRLKDDGNWPFHMITPEAFIEQIQPLISATYDAYQATDIRSTLPPDVLSDRVLGKSLAMLDCLGDMKKEYLMMLYADSSMKHPGRDKTSPLISQSDRMKEIIDWASRETYGLTNRANQYLRPLCEPMGIKLIDLSDANADCYHVDVVEARAQKTVNEHEAAFKDILAQCDAIFNSGIPAETGLGKLRERLDSELRQQRSDNMDKFTKLLDKEIDLHVLESVVIPAIERHVHSQYIKACEEAFVLRSLQALGDDNSRLTGTMEGSRHLTQGGRPIPREQEILAMYDKISQIKKDVTVLREREKGMMPNVNLTIERNPNGQYSVSLTRESGTKREAAWKDGNTEFKQTWDFNKKKDSIQIDLGASEALYTEKQAHYRLSGGITTEIIERNDATNTKKKTIESTAFGEAERESVRRTGISRRFGGDKKEAKDKLKFNLFKLGTQKFRITGPKGAEKEKEFFKASGEFLGASVTGSSLKQGNVGTPTLNVTANALNATANILGFVDVSYSAGLTAKAGAQLSFKDLVKQVSQIFAEELQKGDAASYKKILSDVGTILDEADPSLAENWGSFKMSIKSIDVLSAKVAELDKEKTNQLDIGDNKAIECSLSKDAQAVVDVIKPQRSAEELEAVQKFGFFMGADASTNKQNADFSILQQDARDLDEHTGFELS